MGSHPTIPWYYIAGSLECSIFTVYDQLQLPEDVKGGVIVSGVQENSAAAAGLQELDDHSS